jgi:6,7-dimethyl-8-ribityllumazine synthase
MAGPSSSALELPAFARPPHVMIAEARFYTELADEMARGAIAELESVGATYERFPVAGAFELPAAIRIAMQATERGTLKRPFDGYIARGLQDLAIEYGAAIGYGILTVENDDQAWVRARVSEQNKGGDVARACLGMISLRQRFGLFPR